MTRHLLATGTLIALCTGVWPAAARAQQPAAAAPDLQIRQIQSGPVAAPEVRFGRVNDRDATFVGGYAGWLTDQKLFIGGAGYWLANRDDDFKMQYGGILVSWTVYGDRAVGLSTGVLLGLGGATMARPYGELLPAPAILAPAGVRDDLRRRFDDDALVPVHDDFVLAEPHVNALVKLTPWLRLDAGVGYRFIGASEVLDRHLRGASGSIALRFGGR